MPGLRVIVTGLIAQYPLGGVTWDYLQFVLGLNHLGHEVYYIEDTGQWPYNPVENGLGKSCDLNVRYLSGVMERYGLGERWAYRFPWQAQWYGLSERRRREVVGTADLVINVSGTLARPHEYRSAKRLVYIDSDPVFTQAKIALGQRDLDAMIRSHDVHFSFGETLSAKVPETGYHWIPTRQPIVLSEWQSHAVRGNRFTTVMNWTSYKALKYGGQEFGQKDVELMRFVELPSLVAPIQLELAVAAGKTSRTPRSLLSHKGWRLADPNQVCPDLDSYRQYIRGSMAEWSVAKNGYVKGKVGWFSCRSACYLAAGRPVVVQDTGFSSVLPTGEGIIPFSTLDEAVAGIREATSHHRKHSQAAQEIASGYFDAGKVLDRLLEDSFRAEPSYVKEENRR